MLGVGLLAVLCWVCASYALGWALRLRGLLIFGRSAPRWLAVVPLGVLIALGGGLAETASTGQVLPWLVGGSLIGLAFAVLLPSLRPMRPDDAFLPGTRLRGAWTAREVHLPEHPFAGAVVLEPDAPRPDGASVLIGHGGGNDRVYGLWPLLPELLARGFRVFLAHLPGHGAGGEDIYSTRSGRTRLDALIAAAREDFGSGRIVLLGQSMGAAFALDALLRGAPVDRVVAISAPIELDGIRGGVRELGAFLRRPIYRALRFGTAPELLPAVGPFRRAHFPVRLEKSFRHYLDAFAATVAELDLEARLCALPDEGAPILFVHGTADRITPVGPVPRVVAALPRRSRAVLVAGMRHIDPLFRPEVVEAVCGFL